MNCWFRDIDQIMHYKSCVFMKLLMRFVEIHLDFQTSAVKKNFFSLRYSCLRVFAIMRQWAEIFALEE